MNLLLFMNSFTLKVYAYKDHGIKMRASTGGSVVKNPFMVQKTWVWSLGQEGPLEKETAIHSSIPAWEIPWTEEPGWPLDHKSQNQVSY